MIELILIRYSTVDGKIIYTTNRGKLIINFDNFKILIKITSKNIFFWHSILCLVAVTNYMDLAIHTVEYKINYIHMMLP